MALLLLIFHPLVSTLSVYFTWKFVKLNISIRVRVVRAPPCYTSVRHCALNTTKQEWKPSASDKVLTLYKNSKEYVDCDLLLLRHQFQDHDRLPSAVKKHRNPKTAVFVTFNSPLYTENYKCVIFISQFVFLYVLTFIAKHKKNLLICTLTE